MSDQETPPRHLRLVRNNEPVPVTHAVTYPAGRFSNMFGLSGRVALVVGGGGGIGGAIAHALADFGARIVIADLDLDSATAVSESCRRPGQGDPLAVRLDVTDHAMVGDAVGRIETETRRIDILINSAGINIRRQVVDYTPEEFMRIININLSGVFYVTQAVARGMLQRGYGRVVTLGSVSSLLGHPEHAPYAATKGGIAIMTKAMATEWATRGITVNALGPAYTVTGLITDFIADDAIRAELTSTIPMGRLGTPEDIVGAAVYLCSDAAGFVTGHTLYVDGGRTAD